MSADVKGPVPRRSILNIAAYVPGDVESGAERVFKLSSNETPLGASKAAIEAYRQNADQLHLYPDGASTSLRQAIASAHGLNADRIVCGAGSDELLSLLAQCYLSAGDEAIFTEHGFLIYKIAILSADATPVVAPETDCTANVDAILDCVSEKTRMVFLANPNNPTGTYLPFNEIKRLHAGLPNQAVLVIDAAYAEYVRRNDYESGIELVGQAENVVMTRTFSKIHGLANLRLGWLYGPEGIVDAINRVRGPFNVTGPALAAGVAAITDKEHVDAAVRHNQTWMPWLEERFTDLGLSVTPSVANFLLVHFPEQEGKNAAEADAFLRAQGIVLRRVAAYGFPNALRMSIGTEEANHATVNVLAQFLQSS